MKGFIFIVVLFFIVTTAYGQRFQTERGTLSSKNFSGANKNGGFSRPGVGNGSGPGGGNGGGNGNGNGSGGGGNLPPVPINSGMSLLIAASSIYFFRLVRKSIIQDSK